MPLLNKQPFIPRPVPDGTTRETRLWHCKPTGEFFASHEDFFKRMILLNTTSWSCSMTRKSNLTYFEAVQSEKEAEKELIEFPESLELPILFITHKYTNRGRFEELVNDIYHIMKDRFFMNEEVTFNEKTRKLTARIVTSYCTQQQILDANGMEVEIGHEIKEPLLPGADSYRYTIEILEQGLSEGDKFREHISNEKLFRSKNVGARQKIRLFLKNSCHLPPDGDRYTIRECFIPKVESLWWSDVMSGSEPMCPQTPVLQRGRIPNMLKNGEDVGGGAGAGERKERTPKREKRDPSAPPRPRGRPPKTPEQRALAQQEKKQRKRAEAPPPGPDDFDLTSSGALTFHGHSMTSSSTSPLKKKIRRSSVSKNEKKKAKIIEQQGDLDFYFTEARRLGIDVTGLEQDEKLLSPKKVAEFKMRVKEEKDVEREALKEEKKRKIREKAAYNKKREDLLCNDLKPMPKFPSLEIPTWMSDEEFGDFLFIMQFFSTFKEILPLKEIRGNDEIQFSDIVLAVKCNDPQNSPFADLMRVLLSIRTDIADEEDGDEADFSNRDEIYLINAQNCDPANVVYGESIREISDLHFKIRKIHGKSVRHLPVDWMTLTEVLRLIFETSGYYTGISTHRHRLYARGNYRGYEDPAFEFRHAHPQIMEKLRTQTVFDLEPSERLEIMKTLIYQLLTYSKFRIHLEKHQMELTELRKEQKRLKTWDAGQEADSNAARLLMEYDSQSGGGGGGGGVKDMEKEALVKRFKTYLKALNEGRRYDKEDLDTILLDAVPYTSLTLDEIVTARDLQKAEFKTLMQSITSKLFSTYCKVSDIRLGSDRAYRRYIVIDKLSAILVENPTSSELRIECDEPSVLEISEDSESHDVFRCTGHLESCEVHGTARDSKTRWSYIKNREQFDEFVGSLNARGLREHEMLEELQEYRLNLLELLEDTEDALGDATWQENLMTEEPDPADSYNIDWDAEIRDLLLDFEEKLDQGQMGSIEKKFKISRPAWREKLKENGDVSAVLTENLKIFDEDVVEMDDVIGMSDSRKLAIAFFMIIRSIQLKFIKPPFISPNRDEHGNLKPSELFIRWQRALLQTDSHSALSLFISTFEGAIKWDKSRLQGKCKSCRRKAVAHELILCSECDNCYHLKCAKLAEPEDDWMCTTCRAQHRKTENEAKRMAREELNNISINETDLSSSESQETPSTSSEQQPTTSMIKTASGRSVKKVHYSEVHEGLSLKSRKSNGMVAAAVVTTTPTTPSERPHRNVTMRNYDTDNENNHSDDDNEGTLDASDGENTRKRKIPVAAAAKSKSLVDSPRVIIPTTKEKMSSIESLLKEAMRQECSWPFLQPVDPKEVPDYYDVIERPMDLRTMMNKIKQRVYNKPAEIRVDFEQILTNCETYNETESEIYQLSRELQDFVTARLDAIIDQ